MKIGPFLTARRNKVDACAFFLALFLAPVLTAICLSFLVVPVFAVPIGAPSYLLFGAPAYWITLSVYGNRGHCTSRLVLAGSITNCGTPLLFLAIDYLSRDAGSLAVSDLQGLGGLTKLGAIFAIIWSGVFAWLYWGLARDPHLRHCPEISERKDMP